MENWVRELLEEKLNAYNKIDFINEDPVSIPHLFSRKEDIELSGFLAATIAWGQRKSIINNARRLMNLMDNQPYDFIMHADNKELKVLIGFCHRTFNATDLTAFIYALRRIYNKNGGLENVFTNAAKSGGIELALVEFRNLFTAFDFPERTSKHVANIEKGSSAKRLNMYLRWMVRQDDKGVDFGLWKGISASQLFIPLDVHTGNVSRKLGILKRKQNDWKAVQELTGALKELDINDPVKYDYALFGLGVYDGLKNEGVR